MRRTLLLGLVALLPAMGGCQDQQTNLIPNRVLDRPTDVALACVQFTCESGDCDIEAVSLNQCSNLQSGSCNVTTDGTNTAMVGFLTNSERNEIALFRSCDGTLVDLDHDLPGYNFVPAGTLPTSIDASENGCRIVSANAGSCDLTVLDGPALGALAFDVDPGREPSSLVGQVVPLRLDPDSGDWVPLGARLGEAIAVPTNASNGLPIENADPSACISGQRSSAYVSFPGCDLIAEIDLQDGRIRQSLQFVTEEDGSVRVVPTGVSPACPVDCPAQFPGGLPEGIPAAEPDGVSVSAMHLLDTQEDDDVASPAEAYHLLTGGMGNDNVFDVALSSDGQFVCGAPTGCDPADTACDCVDVLREELIEAKGVQRIRVSPRMQVGVGSGQGVSEEHQFIYAISGDGSTRVVDRDLSDNPDAVGVECDTQVESRDDAVATSICPPVEIPPEGLQPLGRKHFSRGPGIRPFGDDAVTDWAFFPTSGVISSGGEEQTEASELIAPCNVDGVMAVGTTTGGQLVWVHYPEQATETNEVLITDSIDPADRVFESIDSLDPQQLMTLNTAPHSLQQVGTLTLDDLPQVSDAKPPRDLADASGDISSSLSPSLRLIDFAYSRTSGTGATGSETLASIFGIGNVDGLGGESTETNPEAAPAVYNEDAAKVFVRDYQSWTSGEWNLIWEGSIPATSSGTGVVRCAGCESGNPDDPGCGWEGASCKPEQEGDSRLVDSGAQFCDAGVLAGDKIRIFGCTDDSSCGSGSRCLRDASSSSDSGICIPDAAFEDVAERARLRQVCAEFISDPCGRVDREYLVTRAFQDELYLQALDRAPRTRAIFVEGATEGELEVQEREERWLCSEVQPDGGCVTDDECVALLSGSEDDPGDGDFVCLDGLCQRPCTSPDECTLRRLPGPECYSEFLRYEVRAHNSFTVRGYGGADFFTDRVFEDPDTGECTELSTASGVSTLLTSRIRLGPDQDNLGLPACEDDQVVRPTDPNPCLITTPRGSTSVQDDRFHYLEYARDGAGTAVAAVRFANPLLAFTLDLVDLESLGSYIAKPDGDPELWQDETAQFKRSRIPRNYNTAFITQQGYTPAFTPIFFPDSSLPVFFPVRLVKGPGDGQQPFIYVVDASGPGSSSGLRGQVIQGRVCSNSSEEFTISPEFDGVR